MAVNSSNCYFGWKAEDFKLKSVNEKFYTLSELKGEKGTVIVFICNHCPYVIAIANRLSFEANEMIKFGVNTIAIMSNDVVNYPEDSFDKMKIFSKKYSFNFHYLYDESQAVARSYKAECTPDFFGFNKFLELQYRGRIDSGTMNKNTDIIDRELYMAMKLISETNKGPQEQNNSMGCSIKWKNE